MTPCPLNPVAVCVAWVLLFALLLVVISVGLYLDTREARQGRKGGDT